MILPSTMYPELLYLNFSPGLKSRGLSLNFAISSSSVTGLRRVFKKSGKPV